MLSACFGEKWQPVFCPSPEQEALPDFQAFWNRFGRFVVCAPVDLPLLSGEDLRSAVFNMCDHSAGGADGWQVNEIKVWPMFLFQKLADMLNDIEASGAWPDDLLIQIISLIPKDAAGLDQRPHHRGHSCLPRLGICSGQGFMRLAGKVGPSLAVWLSSWQAFCRPGLVFVGRC